MIKNSSLKHCNVLEAGNVLSLLTYVETPYSSKDWTWPPNLTTIQDGEKQQQQNNAKKQTKTQMKNKQKEKQKTPMRLIKQVF